MRSSPTPNSAGRASTRDLRRHLHRAASDIVTTSDVTPSHRERLSTPTDVTAQQALIDSLRGPSQFAAITEEFFAAALTAASDIVTTLLRRSHRGASHIVTTSDVSP